MITHHCCVEQVSETDGGTRARQDVCNGFSHYRSSYTCTNAATFHEPVWVFFPPLCKLPDLVFEAENNLDLI